MSTIMDYGSVYEIAQAVFAAMIDGDEGLLLPWDGDPPVIDDPVVSWVEVEGPIVGRAALTTSRDTAHALARALMGMGADEPVSDDDLVDAFGEIANVVGGNVKALLPDQGTLSMPQVATELPPTDYPMVHELHLAWRGDPLDVVIWLNRVNPEGEI
ncbi:MAG: chemotaxis protein CheX [Micrococcales bacterium]|nr:chemotaxis protein CheX [Micrococcales bacterium]